jgi:DNA modification methylase
VHGAGPPSGRLIHGDAERVLPALAPELEGRVDLVYVDPPFDTGGSFDHLVAIPGRPERVAIPAYEDARGLDAWLAWFQAVATGVYRLLAPGGSLYVHLDAHAAHYAKVVLDEIFGVRAFQREIVWRIGWISGFKSQARGWIRNHDTILFYAKGGRPKTFNKTHLPYPPGYVRRDGSPPKGKGYPLDDVWNASDIDRLDSIQIMSFSGEKVGYPTQKNESLVERIVAASSSPGDLVLDCCVGSGTTAVVASKLGRRWVACDASPVAVHVARRRLATMREPPAFVVERGRASPADGQLRAAVSIEGATCTVELAGYRARAPRRSADDGVAWIEGWCVEWDRGAGPARFGSSAWRDRRDVLPLRLQHRYDEPGAHRVRVRAYDARGGQATSLLQVRVTER